MGGFIRPRKVFRLQFDDPELEGLEVRARSVPLGGFLDMIALMDADLADVQPGDAEKVAQLFERFAEALVSWNVEEEDGTPVPATVQGLHSQEIDFVMLIIRAWIAALSQVPNFLPNGSSDGARSVELSMPMESRSPNPMS